MWLPRVFAYACMGAYVCKEARELPDRCPGARFCSPPHPTGQGHHARWLALLEGGSQLLSVLLGRQTLRVFLSPAFGALQAGLVAALAADSFAAGILA